MRSKYIYILLCFFLTKEVECQNFEWLKSFGGYRNDAITASIAENDGSSIFIFSSTQYNFKDTINFGSFNFPLTSLDSNKSYLVRIDSSGKILNAIFMGDFTSSIICKDESDNFYVAGSLNVGSSTKNIGLKTVGSSTFYKKNGNMVLLKYDKNFNLIWANQNGNLTSTPSAINYSEDRIYFIANSADKSLLGNTTFYFDSLNSSSQYGEIDKANGKILWASFIFKNSNPNKSLQITTLQPSKGILYAGLYANKSFDNGNDTFLSGSCIVQIDSIGKIKNKFNLVNSYIRCLSTDGTNLYFGGSYFDSTTFGNKTINSPLILGAYQMLFSASVTVSLKPKWFFQPKVINTSKDAGWISHSFFKDGFIYFGGTLGTKILVDSHYLTPGNINWVDALIYKTDISGNILWAVNGNSNGNAGINSICALPEKTVFVSGYYHPNINFGKHSVFSKGLNGDGFITRISDNAIIRGKVKAGPYCAGDSLKIPYIKIGQYDTSNSFIAQLSNEFGNFDSAYNELGRVKSNKDGTITGRLPLFRVASSQLYRIRIVSTKPAVQSYYKADTLRLLIYSRDKANPGKAVTICRGDTIKIKTYGGTKWAWSPKYKMADSTAHQTQVWPDKTTRYKIIIADSSGCGQADTAYKTVFVRKDPKIQFVTPADTLICVGGSLPLIANFRFGDSLKYQWQWFAINKLGAYTELKTGVAKNGDTLLYTLPATEKDSQRFVLFLNDGCSPKTDFVFYTLRVNKQKPDAILVNKDTSVCEGSATAFIANFSKGYAPGYNWKWIEKDVNGIWKNILSRFSKKADTLLYKMPLNWNKNKKKILAVVLNDGCSPFADTAVVNITLRDTLQIRLNTYDTLLCKGSKYLWRVSGLGGHNLKYQFKWIHIATGKVLSTADSLLITADSTIKVKVILTDNCMPKSIAISFTIKVNPALKASILNGNNKQAKDTTLCFGQSIRYFAKGTGGTGKGYLYYWKINNILISQIDTFNLNSQTFFNKTGGVQTLVLMMKDNCTVPDDSIKINIKVWPALNISTIFPDSVCYKNNMVFKAKTIGGKGTYQFQWRDANNNLQGTADSLLINYNTPAQNGTVKRIVTVRDGCSLPDSAIVISEFLRPLSLVLTASDTCPLVSSILNANPQGGKGRNYSISWWKGNTSLGITTNPTKTVKPDKVPTLYKALLNDGCSISSDTSIIRIGLRPSLVLKVKGVCLGDTLVATVSNRLAISFKYDWQTNTPPIFTKDSILKAIYPATGSYRITVNSDITQKCIGRDTADFSIIEKPKADFNFMRFKDNIGLGFHFTDRSTFANKWLWQFGKGDNAIIRDPDYNFPETGYFKIKLQVSNQNFCFDSIEKIVPVFEEIQFFFPNAFSPNANGLNDDFGLDPSQYYLVKKFHLEIYNRWGERVFETDDVTQHWQGSQQGVYLFKATISDIYGESHEISGAVEVLK